MIRRYGSNTTEEEALLDTAYCDHYSQGSGGEESPLSNSNNKRRTKKKNTKTNGSCLTTLSKYTLLPLLLLTITSLYYSYQLQHELITLSTKLSTATSNISQLATTTQKHTQLLSNINHTLTNHSSVISHFANSVSNNDVLLKLKQLESDEMEREERVTKEMEQTKYEIESVLNLTKMEIDETVGDAQDEINNQVLSVQSTLSSYIRTTQDQFSTENSFMIYQLAGTFTLLGCLISMWHMTSHLRAFNQPPVQRKILAILWMCPIYSITSWLSLVIPSIEGYLAILKDMYEAYVIYTFLSFCIAVLGKGDRNAVVTLLAKHADHLSPPVRCFGCCRKHLGHGIECEDEKRQLADDVLLQCQVCAMQFVFLRPLLTATLFVLKKCHYYGPMFMADEEVSGSEGGMLDYRSPQFYIVILENVSVFLAFSGLLNFYHAVQEDLSWCRPFPKFLCIKGVVFMTFWQGITISFLANATDLLSSGGEAVRPADDGNDEEQVETWAKQAQNFLICLEMLGFSIAHFYCFPVEEWEEGYRPVEDTSKFGDNMALGDFVHDLKLILQHKEKKKRIAKERASKLKSDDSISTVLEEDEELGGSDSTGALQSLLDNVEDLIENGVDESMIVSEERESSGSSEESTGLKPAATSRNYQSTEPMEPLIDTVDALDQAEEGKLQHSPIRVSRIRPTLTTREEDADTTITPRTRNRKSIKEQLLALDAPKELRQATALLLQSTLLDESTARLLTSDILEQPIEEEGGPLPSGEDNNDDGDETPDNNESVPTPGDEDNDENNTDAPESPLLVSIPSSPPPPPPTTEQYPATTDTTPLLSPTPTENDDMLQPSIFTMHSASMNSMSGGSSSADNMSEIE